MDGAIPRDDDLRTILPLPSRCRHTQPDHFHLPFRHLRPLLILLHCCPCVEILFVSLQTISFLYCEFLRWSYQSQICMLELKTDKIVAHLPFLSVALFTLSGFANKNLVSLQLQVHFALLEYSWVQHRASLSLESKHLSQSLRHSLQ